MNTAQSSVSVGARSLYSTAAASNSAIDPQDFLLVYNEQLDYGNTPPVDRKFFDTIDGLEACKAMSGWKVDHFKKLIVGLQPMGKHCFMVQCRGPNEMKAFYDKIPSVRLFGTRLFLGASAENCGMKIDMNLTRVRIEGLPSAIPDRYAIEKLEKYGVPDKKSEKERIRDGPWKGFEYGTRIFYMKHIEDELGLPLVFYIKNVKVRVFHPGQVRGREREFEECRRRGGADVEAELCRREEERKQYRENKRREWISSKQEKESLKETDEQEGVYDEDDEGDARKYKASGGPARPQTPDDGILGSMKSFLKKYDDCIREGTQADSVDGQHSLGQPKSKTRRRGRDRWPEMSEREWELAHEEQDRLLAQEKHQEKRKLQEVEKVRKQEAIDLVRKMSEEVREGNQTKEAGEHRGKGISTTGQVRQGQLRNGNKKQRNTGDKIESDTGDVGQYTGQTLEPSQNRASLNYIEIHHAESEVESENKDGMQSPEKERTDEINHVDTDRLRETPRATFVEQIEKTERRNDEESDKQDYGKNTEIKGDIDRKCDTDSDIDPTTDADTDTDTERKEDTDTDNDMDLRADINKGKNGNEDADKDDADDMTNSEVANLKEATTPLVKGPDPGSKRKVDQRSPTEIGGSSSKKTLLQTQ